MFAPLGLVNLQLKSNPLIPTVVPSSPSIMRTAFIRFLLWEQHSPTISQLATHITQIQDLLQLHRNKNGTFLEVCIKRGNGTDVSEDWVQFSDCLQKSHRPLRNPAGKQNPIRQHFLICYFQVRPIIAEGSDAMAPAFGRVKMAPFGCLIHPVPIPLR